MKSSFCQPLSYKEWGSDRGVEVEEEEENGGEERGNCSGLAHTSSFHNWRSGCARKGLSSSGLPKPLFLQDNLSLAASCRQHLAETDF